MTKVTKGPSTSWLPSPLLCKSFGSKIVNTASIKKALAMSQPIFKLKKNDTSSQDRFFWKDEDPDSASAVAAKASRQSASLPIHQLPPQQTFFCFRKVKSKLAHLSMSQGSLITNLEEVI
jgi:hypothetical protein